MLLFFVILHLCSLLQCSKIPKTTRLGQVYGLLYTTPKGNKGEKYLGLPYAQKPIGKYRFEYPLALKRWPQQPYDATYQRPRCIQSPSNLAMDEDCLYMNIFTPTQGQRWKYPVLFWIHGGSYEVGGANQFDVDGAIDNFASRGVVLVTINYRLGVLGFMSLLNASLPGNYGLEDQLAALKWVNDNIEDFGGDKRSITICGESAGGASVNLLTLSPKAQGLFHRAIIISGAAIAPWALAPATTKSLTEKLLHRLKCHGWTTLQCLKNTNVWKLMNIFETLSSNNKQPGAIQNFVHVVPVIDGYRRENSILPDALVKLTSKRSQRVPVLMGLTAGELPVWPNDLWENLLPYSRLRYGLKSLNSIKEKYMKHKPNHKLDEQKRKAFNDYMMNVPMCLMAKSLKARGAPVYFYLYDLRSAKTNALPYHGADVAFLFKNRSLILNNPPMEDLPLPSTHVHLMMFESFTNFIKTGNPNTPSKLPMCWPEYRAGASNVVWLQNKSIRLTDCFEDEMTFWKALDQEYAQFGGGKL